jgi:hypothetical protein
VVSKNFSTNYIATRSTVDRSLDLTEKLLTSEGAVGWAFALGILAAFVYREWSRHRFYKKFDKVDIAKVAGSIGGTWQKTMKIFENIQNSSDRSERKLTAIWQAIDTVRRDIADLKSKIAEVKEVSKEVGEDFSGQLHDLEDFIDRKIEGLRK